MPDSGIAFGNMNMGAMEAMQAADANIDADGKAHECCGRTHATALAVIEAGVVNGVTRAEDRAAWDEIARANDALRAEGDYDRERDAYNFERVKARTRELLVSEPDDGRVSPIERTTALAQRAMDELHAELCGGRAAEPGLGEVDQVRRLEALLAIEKSRFFDKGQR